MPAGQPAQPGRADGHTAACRAQARARRQAHPGALAMRRARRTKVAGAVAEERAAQRLGHGALDIVHPVLEFARLAGERGRPVARREQRVARRARRRRRRPVRLQLRVRGRLLDPHCASGPLPVQSALMTLLPKTPSKDIERCRKVATCQSRSTNSTSLGAPRRLRCQLKSKDACNNQGTGCLAIAVVYIYALPASEGQAYGQHANRQHACLHAARYNIRSLPACNTNGLPSNAATPVQLTLLNRCVSLSLAWYAVCRCPTPDKRLPPTWVL